jgi:UDP-N-acetylmuramate dehydrogenase
LDWIIGISCGDFGFGGLDMSEKIRDRLPKVAGNLSFARDMADLSWLRVGGPAEVLFQPADLADLQGFLRGLPCDVPVFPIGVCSNLIIRDGGIDGVVIRFGRGFNGIEILEGNRVRAGVAALDAHVARKAAQVGIDLTFLRTIPGALGGAARMNAGCYGSYTADIFLEAQAVTREGEVVTLQKTDMGFAYRSTRLPEGMILTSVLLQGGVGVPEVLAARMDEQLAKRNATQPTKERSCGSTFRNPAGFSSTGCADDVHDLKAWKVIDDAGMRGATLGGAQMSEMHSNFLINKGGASAADLENLGELVRKRVLETSGISLEWEIMRIGKPTP